MRARTAASLTVAGCALAWGFLSMVVREIALPAAAIVFWRMALTAGALAGGLTVAGRRDLLRRPGPAAFAAGLLVAAHWVLFFAAIKETSAASAVLVTYVGPALAALLAPLVVRERLSGTAVAALAVSLGGIALIAFGAGGEDDVVRPLGIGLAAGAAVLFAALLVLLKRYAGDVNPLTWVLYEAIAGAAALALVAGLGGDVVPEAADVGYVVLLGLVLTGALGIAFIAAVPHVPVTTTGVLMYVEPMSAAVLAAVFLGEALTWQVAAGGAAIVAAGVAVVLAGRAPTAPSLEEPVSIQPSPAPARAGR
jgi:drug/metabolite transporter (DMT)-like permease